MVLMWLLKTLLCHQQWKLEIGCALEGWAVILLGQRAPSTEWKVPLVYSSGIHRLLVNNRTSNLLLRFQNKLEQNLKNYSFQTSQNWSLRWFDEKDFKTKENNIYPIFHLLPTQSVLAFELHAFPFYNYHVFFNLLSIFNT